MRHGLKTFTVREKMTGGTLLWMLEREWAGYLAYRKLSADMSNDRTATLPYSNSVPCLSMAEVDMMPTTTTLILAWASITNTRRNRRTIWSNIGVNSLVTTETTRPGRLNRIGRSGRQRRITNRIVLSKALFRRGTSF